LKRVFICCPLRFPLLFPLPSSVASGRCCCECVTEMLWWKSEGELIWSLEICLRTRGAGPLSLL